MEKNNVILMAPLPPPAGGIGRWTQRFLKLSNQYGINCLLVNETLIGKRKVFGNKNRINPFNELKRTLGIWNQLRKSIKKVNENSFVVHCCIPAFRNSLLREIHSARIVKRKKGKFVIHFRSTVPNSIKGKFDIFLLKKMLKICDQCIVLNEKSFEYISSLTSKEKISLIPNFVDEKETIAIKNVAKDLKKVIYVGGVIEEKGCDTIINVAKEFPDLVFNLVGNPSEQIIRLASKQKNVVLLGEQPTNTIISLLDDSDVFMFLSRFEGEGFSNAVIEAMGRGLPCIVTDWAANKEQIGDMANKYNLCVPILDCSAVIMALRTLHSFDIRKEVSLYNINRVATHYNNEIIIKQYIRIYDTLLKKG